MTSFEIQERQCGHVAAPDQLAEMIASKPSNASFSYQFHGTGEDIAQELEDLACSLCHASSTLRRVRALCLEYPDEPIRIQGNGQQLTIHGPEELMIKALNQGLAATFGVQEVVDEPDDDQEDFAGYEVFNVTSGN